MSRLLVSDRIATVFGGSGFLGRHVVRALAQRGWRIRVAVRRPDLANFLQPLGSVGQIHAVQANLRYAPSVARALDGADAVVNLVGILHETGRQHFQTVQALGPRRIAEATADAGARGFVQVSALGADPDSPSAYARSKAAGERGALEAFPDAVVMRPSILFGPEDSFFNRFAAMARLSPFLPLIGGGTTRFQPVFAGDVAEAIARALEGQGRPGTIYELGGPEVKTFKELLRYVLEVTGRHRPLISLPFGVARLQARALQLLPNPLLTVDQVKLLERDNVVSEAAIREGRTFAAFGIQPTAIEAVAPTYLYRFRKSGQFDHQRAA